MRAKAYKIISSIYSVLIIIFITVLAAASLVMYHNAFPQATSAVPLKEFTYQIAGDEGGRAVFPHSFKNLAPNTAVTVNTEIEPGKYGSLLMKTVYSGLTVYADDILIYQCGQPGSYPTWMLDPPTLLEIIHLPQDAKHLRLEYISPSQRSTMSVPAPMAGSDEAILLWLFGTNAALLIISFLMLFIGLGTTVLSFCFWRSQSSGRSFSYLGLFSLATGCWGFGECNATAFIIPYPTLLYCMAFGGLAAMVIPILSYGLLILRPNNPLPMKIARDILRLCFITVFALQLFGIKSLSNTLYVIQILAILGLLVFAGTALLEHFRHNNKTARWFAIPSLVLFAASLLEYINYSKRFTSVLSLFFLTGTLIFTFMLGVIGMLSTKEMVKRADEAKRMAVKINFMRQMSHDLRTPLTKVSTNVQTAMRRPGEADGLLSNSQVEIMKMAKMIDDALKDGDEGGVQM